MAKFPRSTNFSSSPALLGKGVPVLAGFLALACLSGGPVNAIQVNLPALSLTVDGSATKNANWEYRYKITNLLNVNRDSIRFVINEAPNHAGLHHEFNKIGAMVYDQNVAGFPPLRNHNYFWNNLNIGALNSVTVGFDDIHGPTLEAWGIQAGGNHVENNNANYLPVPSSVPGPLPIFGVGAFFGFSRRLRSRIKARASRPDSRFVGAVRLQR